MKMTEREQAEWHRQYEAAHERRRSELTQPTNRFPVGSPALVQRKGRLGSNVPPKR